MAFELGTIAGVSVAFGATITLWYTIASSRIREITRDLIAGDRFRTEYVIRETPNLAPDLSSALDAVKKLEQTHDPHLSYELRKTLEKLVSRVKDLTDIESAQSNVIRALRKCRDRGLLLIVGIASLVFVFLGSAYIPGVSEVQVASACVGLGYISGLALGAMIIGQYSEYRRIVRLLQKYDLTAVGV